MCSRDFVVMAGGCAAYRRAGKPLGFAAGNRLRPRTGCSLLIKVWPLEAGRKAPTQGLGIGIEETYRRSHDAVMDLPTYCRHKESRFLPVTNRLSVSV